MKCETCGGEIFCYEGQYRWCHTPPSCECGADANEKHEWIFCSEHCARLVK